MAPCRGGAATVAAVSSSLQRTMVVRPAAPKAAPLTNADRTPRMELARPAAAAMLQTASRAGRDGAVGSSRP